MALLTTAQQAVLTSNSWFAKLPQEVQADIVRAARLRVLSKGKCLYKKGQPPDGWYCVISGVIRIGSTTTDGRGSVLGWHEPGSWFGEISLFDGHPRSHDSFAYRPAEVLVVLPSEFDSLLSAHPELGRAFIAQQCRRQRMLFAMVDDMTMQPLEIRLARQLLNLAARYGTPKKMREVDGTLINLHLPQEELAQLLGVSRQRINQAMKTWERDGLLYQSYGCIIIDAVRLQALIEDKQ